MSVARARLTLLCLAACCDGSAGAGDDTPNLADVTAPATRGEPGVNLRPPRETGVSTPRATTIPTYSASGSPDVTTTASGGAPFDEFPHDRGPPDLGVRQCDEAADPAGAPDKIFIHWKLEGGRFGPPDLVAEHGLRQPHRVVFGGDMNAALYVLDLDTDGAEETTRPLFGRGYLDAHRSLPAGQRTTHDPGLVLDLLVSSGPFTSAPGLCSFADCPGLSDHTPIWWATVALE